MEKRFSVDDQDSCTLQEFLEANGDDTEGINQSEIEALQRLEVGESIYIHICEVKRVQ